MNFESPPSSAASSVSLTGVDGIFHKVIAALWISDHKLAKLLVTCSSFHVSIHPEQNWFIDGYTEGYFARFFVAKSSYDKLREILGTESDTDVEAYKKMEVRRDAIRAALGQALPLGFPIHSVQIRPELQTHEESHVESLIEILGTAGINNQAADLLGTEARTWQNFRFRSATEVKVAGALDKAGVLFLPNCKARLGDAKARINREADFLVCHKGKWGILEADGSKYHPKSRTSEDHKRDRLFKAHGIRVVEHFDAEECYEYPDLVVKRFLDLLEMS